MVHFLHDSHPQAGDDEDESGANVSQVTRPEESAARPHMSPIPTHAQIRGRCHPPAVHNTAGNLAALRLNIEPQGDPEALDGTVRSIMCHM